MMEWDEEEEEEEGRALVSCALVITRSSSSSGRAIIWFQVDVIKAFGPQQFSPG